MFLAFVFLTDVESTVPHWEFSPFLSLGHSDAKEKAILLLILLTIRWHQCDLAWLLVAPPGQKPWGQFDSLGWCFSVGQMFYNSQPLSNGIPIPLLPCSNHLWATKDRAQPQFFSKDLMEIHPNPVLAPTSRICKWEHSSLPQIGDLVSIDQPFSLSVANTSLTAKDMMASWAWTIPTYPL